MERIEILFSGTGNIIPTPTSNMKMTMPSIIVPYEEKELISFAYPPFCSSDADNYRSVGAKILQKELTMPTGNQIAALVYAAYCIPEFYKEIEFRDVRVMMTCEPLWVFNKNVWTDEGVYVFYDKEAKGLSKNLEVNELEKILEDAKNINGIRFSNDGKVRFASKETYKLEDNTPDELAQNGFVIASYGRKGAGNLAEVSSTFQKKAFVHGLDIEKGQKSEQRVSALFDVGILKRMSFHISGKELGNCKMGHSFGVK